MSSLKNQSIGVDTNWTEGDLTFREVIRQEYANCVFSGGFVDGHPIDTLYIQAEKDGVVTTSLLLRPDEVAAIAWVAAGVLWSNAMLPGKEIHETQSLPTT